MRGRSRKTQKDLTLRCRLRFFQRILWLIGAVFLPVTELVTSSASSEFLKFLNRKLLPVVTSSGRLLLPSKRRLSFFLARFRALFSDQVLFLLCFSQFEMKERAWSSSMFCSSMAKKICSVDSFTAVVVTSWILRICVLLGRPESAEPFSHWCNLRLQQ